MLESESLIRIVDQLGRVVIPSGLRWMMRINGGDALEVYLEDREDYPQKIPAQVFVLR